MTHDQHSTDADRPVRLAGHVLFVVLMAIGVVRVAVDGNVLALIMAAVTSLWYAAGAVRAARENRHQVVRLWLSGLIVLWLILIVISGEFIWLAFLLAMLAWQMFDRRIAVPVIVLIAVATVVSFGVHQGQWLIGAIIGPLVGIGSAVVITEVYQRQRAQSEDRKVLLHELTATQQALADREREAGRLAERERLARDIHDTVGQSLASVVLLLRAALAPARSADPVAERETQLQTALAATLAALADTRRFVRGLDPEVLTDGGLVGALSAAATESTGIGLPTEFEQHGDVRRLDTAAEVALLRAAQEALSNARNHSRATKAVLTLTFMDDEATVDVVDDGVGFDPATVGTRRADGSGYGLSSMRARIDEQGGRLDIESEPGGGTAIRVAVPCRVTS